MKICIPIINKELKSKISLTFARSPSFAIVDDQTKIVMMIDNPYAALDHGVGNKLMDWMIIEYNIDTLIAFELGQKVQQIANEHKLQLIILSEKNQTLEKLLIYKNIK